MKGRGEAVVEGPCNAMKRRPSTNQAARRRCHCNFQVGGIPGAQGQPKHTTYTELWEISMCAQNLSCMKPIQSNVSAGIFKCCFKGQSNLLVLR